MSEQSETRSQDTLNAAQPASPSPIVEGILAHNRAFVERGEYERYATDKYPDKKLAIVSCMDTRLTELLSAALGLKNGDAKIIKVAGAEVAHPFGSVMRSLLIAVCELGVEDVMIVAHTNCGAQHMSGEEMVHDMRRLGMTDDRIELACHSIDFTAGSASAIPRTPFARASTWRNHSVMPPHVRVGGDMDSTTGRLAIASSRRHAQPAYVASETAARNVRRSGAPGPFAVFSESVIWFRAIAEALAVGARMTTVPPGPSRSRTAGASCAGAGHVVLLVHVRRIHQHGRDVLLHFGQHHAGVLLALGLGLGGHDFLQLLRMTMYADLHRQHGDAPRRRAPR
ncbi:MAG: beta-class carbonic anhydrase [Eggerthellaceae bacterium]